MSRSSKVKISTLSLTEVPRGLKSSRNLALPSAFKSSRRRQGGGASIE